MKDISCLEIKLLEDLSKICCSFEAAIVADNEIKIFYKFRESTLTFERSCARQERELISLVSLIKYHYIITY